MYANDGFVFGSGLSHCICIYIIIYIRARVKHRKTRLSEDALKDPDSTHEK